MGTSKFEAMREALELARIGLRDWEDPETRYKALRAIDAALARPDDEPVASVAVFADPNCRPEWTFLQSVPTGKHYLYAAPQPPAYDKARERELEVREDLLEVARRVLGYVHQAGVENVDIETIVSGVEHDRAALREGK